MIRGRIYRLVSDKTDQVYIGSTTKSLAMRLAIHKYHAKINFCTSSKPLFLDDSKVKIELLEEKDFTTRRELLDEENQRILEAGDKVINKRIPKTKEKKDLEIRR